MKILMYECKKILNIKLLGVLLLFTILFYDMFMGIVSHPGDNAACVAQNDLASILKDEYGTALPYEDFEVLEEVRQEQVNKLDGLVRKSSILQEAGITSYEQLRSIYSIDSTEMEEDVLEELYRIDFQDGIRPVFLKQHIEGLYEMMEFHPVIGIESGKEAESADIFLSHTIEDGYTQDALSRVANVIKENKLSLLPDSVLFHLESDFPRFGILLMISCLILILPYQIKERLAGVNPLFVTSNLGRRIWKKRYYAVLISSIILCILQFLIFCAVLEKSDILQYWNYSVNGNGSDFYWFNMNLGTYVILKMLLYIFLTLGIATIFYLISRVSANYIVGTAIGIPTAVVFGVLTVHFTMSFLDVTKGVGKDLLLPLGFLAIILCIATVIVCSLKRWDQGRDIFI